MATHITRMAIGWEMGALVGGMTGTTGEWGNSTSLSTVEQVASAARSGLYGLRIHPAAAAAKQSREFNLSQAWLERCYYRYPAGLPGANAHIRYLGQGGGAETNGVQVRFRQSDSKLILVELDAAGAVLQTDVGPVIASNTWFMVEILYRCNMSVAWRVDQALQTGLTIAGTNRAINSIFFGSNTAQTFDLNCDDLYAAYSADDAGENGAALVAEGWRGPGYCKRLVAVSTSSPDSGPFSTTDASAIGSSHQVLDDDPLMGAPGVRQDTVGATKYMEYGLTQLEATEVPHALSAITEFRQTGGGASDATLKITKDAAEQTIVNQAWDNGPGLTSVLYLPGDSQTTKWTKAQVNAATVRWGYSANVTNPPVIGGFMVTADVSPVDPFVAGPVFDVQTTVASAKGWRKIPDVHFSIDDIHVDQDEDWVLRHSAYGGHLDGAIRIPGRQAKRHPLSIDAGAPVVAYTQSLDRIYVGEIAHPPRIGEDGQAELDLVGPWHKAESAAEVLAYQVRGSRLFAEGDEDPYGYNQNDGFELTQAGGKIQFKAPKGEDFVAGQVASFVIWIPGANFTRYAFVINKNRDLANFNLRVRAGVGPSGSLTTIATHSLDNSNPTGTEKINSALGGEYDLLMFQIHCQTDISNLSERLRVWLTSLRVNDRALDDDMSASDVVADVGEQLGWNTDGVVSTSANVLPLLWQEAWSELLLYMADLENHYVRRVAGGLEYGPFGEQDWEVLRSFSGTPDLRQLDPYNRAVVKYTTVSGKPAEVTVDADPDPLPGEVRVLPPYELEDPQANDILPTALAERLIAKYSRLRWAGFVDVVKARHRSGPLAILPGDTARVLDWDQGKDLALPIHGIEQRRDRVRLSIESPISLVQLMEEARRGLGLPRRGRGKNKKGNR